MLEMQGLHSSGPLLHWKRKSSIRVSNTSGNSTRTQFESTSRCKLWTAAVGGRLWTATCPWGVCVYLRFVSLKLLYIMRRANSQYIVMSKQIAFTSETLRAAQARVCSSVYISPCETCMLGLQKYPGSSGAKKLSIPSSFVSVLNTFGSPIHFQFFGFLATLQLINRQRPGSQHSWM